MEILQQLIYGLTVGSVYALIALGFSIIFQTTGLLSFAHQEVMVIGGMLGYTLLVSLGLPYPLALIGVLLVCAAVSVAIEKFCLAPIRNRRGGEINSIVATIGIGIVINNAVMLIWGAYPLSYPQEHVSLPLNIGGIKLDSKQLGIFVVSLLAMVVLQFFLKMTRAGIAMRAAAADSVTAALMGISAQRASIVSFALSGALAGLAGILIGDLYYTSFEMGTVGLKSLSAAVLGGFGSLPGAIAGGLALGVLETLVSVHLKGEFADSIVFSLLIVVLLTRPSGLFGRQHREI